MRNKWSKREECRKCRLNNKNSSLEMTRTNRKKKRRRIIDTI